MKSLVSIAASLMLAFSANAGVFEICPTCRYQSLQAAVDACTSGDTIVVKTGTYISPKVLIEKRVTIIGEQGAILDGDGETILYVEHDSITVANLTLQNVSTNYVEDRAAIKCNDGDYFQFINLKVRHSFFGILVEKSSHGVIRNCEVVGDLEEKEFLESANGNAIHLWYCKDVDITENVVKNHRDGIYFEFVEDSRIYNNWSEGNMRYGLHFMFSHDDKYHDNTFTKNGAGVAVMYSSNVTMLRNDFIDNWGESAYGLLLKDISDSELRHNRFINNTIAISADNSSRIEFTDNVFGQNGYAMRILGNCESNTITRNDFLGNSFDITTNSKTSYNDFSGNYWEEYSGYDLDHDGVGDIPHRPVKLFTSIIAQSPTSIILMRSTFIDLLNLAEKITPVLTPENLLDERPQLSPLNDHL